MSLNKLRSCDFKKAAIIVALLWVLAQIVLMIIYWNHTQVSDARQYCSSALQVVTTGHTYPSMANVNDMYIHAPGFVNFLALQYWIFGTFKANYIINFILNIFILFEIYYLGRKLFSEKVGNFAVIIYCLIFSNMFVPLHNMSDHPSYFLMLTGLCLTLSKKWYYLVIASVCYALAYTFRPTVMAFMVCSIVFLIVYKRKALSYVCLIVPYFVVLIAIGEYNKKQCGYFLTTSSLGGFGLAHGANPETATYANMTVFWHKDNKVAYIENGQNLSFATKDSIWRARATQWIKDNPKRYFSLCIPRLLRAYSADWWSLDDVVVLHGYENAIHSANPQKAMLQRRLMQFVESIPYYLMILLFIVSLVINRKSILSKRGVLLIITALSMGVALLGVAELRSHYAYLFVMVLWAAYGVDTLIAHK